jgi:hypothetical protein
MNRNQDIWYALQSKVSNVLQNWDLHRPYTARLEHRIQGFTEEWESVPFSDRQNQPKADDVVAFEVKSTQHPDDPKCNVRLFQYRPAWLEQLVLRVGGIEHMVLNSRFAVTEVTGPLPYLQDLDGEGSKADSPSPPAMIGRGQARDGTNSDENGILEYLKLYRGVDLDSVLVTEDQRQQSALYRTILRDTLAPCLLSLRYHSDPIVWYQIYRPQCIRATSGSINIWSNKPILAMWQAWSERVHAVFSSPPSIRSQPKECIIATARQMYTIFEHRIQLQQSSSKNYFFGTEKPSLVDCLLWDHLMQAMADIHLVVVLADFPGLLKFSQHIWDTFSFGSAIDRNVTGLSCSCWVWNLEENVLNSFAEIPLIPPRRKSDSDNDYETVIDQMEKIALPYLDLRKTLVLVKNRRSESCKSAHRHRPFATWHSWRMGDGFFPKKTTVTKTKMSSDTVPNTAEDQIRRQYQRNDEVWMVSVSAATILAMLSFGLSGFNG